MRKPKQLYGHWVCKKCFYNLANRRQLAYIIDSLVWEGSLAAIFGAFTAILLQVGTTPNAVNITGSVLGYMMIPIFFLKDGFNGRSLGKKVCGVHVVDKATLQPISFGRSFKRNIILIVPVLPIIVAFTLAKGQRLGDGWAKTKVIWDRYAGHPIFCSLPLCESCGYDLRGNTSGACPECGHAISEWKKEQLAAAELITPTTPPTETAVQNPSA